MDLLAQLSTLLKQAKEEIATLERLSDWEQAKSRWLGKKGALGQLMLSLKDLDTEAKKLFGKNLNEYKENLELLFAQQKATIEAKELEKKIAQEQIDITLPGWQPQPTGGLHPISLAIESLQEIFFSMGFLVQDGPEVEHDELNFTALNMPRHHPARSMHDTFYLADTPSHVLRTHTSPVQIRGMLQQVRGLASGAETPEIRIIAPGRVYRVDSDATHSPMFHQLEGVWVGKSVTLIDLKNVFTHMLRCFFEDDSIEIRFRASFFPFTEPSAELDMSCVFCHGKGCRVCSKTGWLEVAGSGMMHPNVLRNAGIDPTKNQGFAFGVGIDRLAMLRYQVSDLRLMFENDIRFLKQWSL